MKYLVLLSIVIAYPFDVMARKTVLNRKTQTVDFEGDTVDGKVRTPDGSYLVQKRSVDFVPLYQVREHFDEEIRTSVNFLK